MLNSSANSLKSLAPLCYWNKKGRKMQFIGMFFMANPKHLNMHFHDLMKYICCNSLCILIPDRLQWALKKGNRLWLHWIDIWDGFLSAYFIRKCTLKAIDGTWHALHTGMKSIMKENYIFKKLQFINPAHYNVNSIIFLKKCRSLRDNFQFHEPISWKH